MICHYCSCVLANTKTKESLMRKEALTMPSTTAKHLEPRQKRSQCAMQIRLARASGSGTMVCGWHCTLVRGAGHGVCQMVLSCQSNSKRCQFMSTLMAALTMRSTTAKHLEQKLKHKLFAALQILAKASGSGTTACGWRCTQARGAGPEVFQMELLWQSN